MKKIILLLSLLLLPLAASAQQGDTLITPDGTMYSIQYERARQHPDVTTDSSVYLVLTTRRGEEVTREVVPATHERGAHFNPAIAYDAQSGTLFAFWIHNTSMLLSQLMFASRDADGVWSEAEAFGQMADRRENLRIAVTRKYEEHDGTLKNGLSVHLAWWQFNSSSVTRTAHYAIVTIEEGKVLGVSSLDLDTFVPKNVEPATEEINEAAIMQPLLFTSPRQDSVLVVFGDVESGTLHNVRVTPKVASNGRLRVPGGKREGRTYRAPSLDVVSGSRIEGVYGDDGRLAFYTEGENGQVRYVTLKDGQWSEQRTIATDEHLSRFAVIDALRRLVTEH